MRVIVLASQKGGAGKTTLAAHVAVAAVSAGMGPVCLLDTDPQGTLTTWWKKRDVEAPAMATVDIAELPAKIGLLKEQGFELVVIDTPPAITTAIRTVIAVADLVLIPVRPSPADLWAVGATLNLCVEEGRPFVFVLSQATKGATITAQAVAALSEHGVVATSLIHNRVSLAGAFTSGQVVQELDPRGQGAQEIAGLLAFVRTRLDASTPDKPDARTKA
jgi:chromosome partitioning protein